MNARLHVLNADTARFECVYPACGGACCQNGRPGLEPAEVARVEANLSKFIDRLTPRARARVLRDGFMTKRVKEGRATMGVVDGMCLFFNDGCVLHQVGAEEGDKSRYKPWHCVVFPLSRDDQSGAWHVRQWGVREEAWEVFCLNPKESPKLAALTLKEEIAFGGQIDHGSERWRFEKPAKKPRSKRTGR